MNRLMSICLILLFAVSISRAQDPNAPTTDGTPFPAAIPATTESLPPSSKAIVLVIDADAQESVVFRSVAAAAFSLRLQPGVRGENTIHQP